MNTEEIKIYDAVLQKSKVQLNSMQDEKFKEACKRVLIDNPDLDFNNHVIAATVWLKNILDFPTIQFPPGHS